MTGGHPGGIVGVYVDRLSWIHVGSSLQLSGTYRATNGEGAVSVPGALATSGERTDIETQIGFEFPLAPIVRTYVDVPVAAWSLGAGWEAQLWNLCCGAQDGDLAATVVSKDGDALGEADGLAVELDEVIYSPRRLWNANSGMVLASRPIRERFWAGGQLRYNQFAVPDYAVSAANLDFENIVVQLAGRVNVGGRWRVGLSYSRAFLFTREIEDSAWNLGDGNERFSPAAPATTSGNGTYAASADPFGVRVDYRR